MSTTVVKAVHSIFLVVVAFAALGPALSKFGLLLPPSWAASPVYVGISGAVAAAGVLVAYCQQPQVLAALQGVLAFLPVSASTDAKKVS